MKLVFIAPSAYLLGGVQDWLYMLILALRARGHVVIVGIPDGIFHRAADYNLHYPGINALPFKNKSGSHEGRIRALTKFLSRNPSDIIVGVNIGDLYEAYRRYALCYKHTYLVMTLHAIESDYLNDINKYSDILDSVITTNKLTQRIVIDQGLIEKERVLYAPYGVETNVPTTICTHGSRLRIAWVGRIDNEQKRVSDIRSILTSLDEMTSDYCLSIAGGGPYHTNLEEELSYWIKLKRVCFYGLLSKGELPEFYSKHNILLITSEWETGPIVAWEAMAAGLVVVSSNYVGCASEKALVEGSTALLFPTGSFEIAAKQLFRLRDPVFRNSIAENSRRMVNMRYSKEACISQWEITLTRILGQLAKKKNLDFSRTLPSPSSRLESILGLELSETLRGLISRGGYCYDPGSEWPHSLHGQSNQKALLEYAKRLESNV